MLCVETVFFRRFLETGSRFFNAVVKNVGETKQHGSRDIACVEFVHQFFEVDFHTHCTPGYGLASVVMAMLHGVDIVDTNIWYFGGGTAAPAIELVYLFAKRLDINVEVNMEAVGKIRKALKEERKQLADFDLHKNDFPIDFDPLTDKLPAEIDALFDKAVAAAKADDEEALLDACHAIEKYFNFPKPNELVKEAEVPGGMYSNMVAQLKTLKSEDLLDDSMRLIPKVRRDAGLVPLVTPTSQIVGSQAVSLAIDRKKGNPDYSNASNQVQSSNHPFLLAALYAPLHFF